MKKFLKSLFTTMIVAMLAITVVGCSSTNNSSDVSNSKTSDAKTTSTSKKTTEKSTSELNKTKIMQDIEMTPKTFAYKQDDTFNEKGKKLTVIEMNIKNKTSMSFGVGAGDFYLQTKSGDKIKTYGYHDSFGEMIEAGKELTGNAYFAIPENQTDNYTLVYSPINNENNVKIEWKLGSVSK